MLPILCTYINDHLNHLWLYAHHIIFTLFSKIKRNKLSKIITNNYFKFKMFWYILKINASFMYTHIKDSSKTDLDVSNMPNGSVLLIILSTLRLPIKKIVCVNCNLTSLDFLNGFPLLTYLDMSNNNIGINTKGLTSVLGLTYLKGKHCNLSNIPELSKLVNLVTLNLSSNHISKLKITKMKNLEILKCKNNKITVFPNLANLSKLRIVSMCLNSFMEYNLPKPEIIEEFSIGNCYVNRMNIDMSIKLYNNIPLELTEFVSEQTCNSSFNVIYNLDKMVNLQKLHFVGFYTQTLNNICNLTQLTFLDCSNCKLHCVDGIENLINLTLLDLSYNNIKIPDLPNLTKLKIFKVRECQLQTLPKLHTQNLVEFVCGSNQLKQLISLKDAVNLEIFYIDNNNLTNIDDAEIDNLTLIISFICHKNKITHLPDLSNFRNLRHLDCSFNMITKLSGLSYLIKLSELICRNNQLTALPNLSNLVNLTALICSHNNITVLNHIPLNSLNVLDVSSNKLSKLPKISYICVKKSNNLCPELYTIDCSNNLLVDVQNIKEITTLRYFKCSNNLLTDIPPIYISDVFKCSHNNLTNLKFLENNFSINTLHCDNNQITTLSDIEHIRVYRLRCAKNKLNTLPSKEFISHLLLFDYDRLWFNFIVVDTESKCFICYIPDNGKLVYSPCNHTFHVNCISNWLQQSSTCPYCRQAI